LPAAIVNSGGDRRRKT